MSKRLEITVSDEVLAGLDAVRGHEPRASFVKRALELALSEAQGPVAREQAGPGPVGSSEPVRPAAPTPGRVGSPAVSDARAVALERQARVNAQRARGKS